MTERKDCFCDQTFHDAADMLSFRHFWCETCSKEICGGGPNHKAMGHKVRQIRAREEKP